ncbi:methyl-accepting chemotaxis protein [Paenibacillus sp. CAU 1782]
MGLAHKITSAIIGLLMLVGTAIGIFSYSTAYRQVEEAVGIELVGCANITTGLVSPGDIEALLKGDSSGLAALEERLNWTVDHKSLFKEVFILSLDGTIIAADQNLKARGYKAGDTFFFDPDAQEMIKSLKHSMYSSVFTFDNTSLMTGYGPIYQDHDPNKEIVALMAINFDASIIQERTMDIVKIPFMIGAAVFLVAAAAVYFYIQMRIKPLSALSAQVHRVSSGNLTVQPLNYRSRDEIGSLARDFDEMTTNLRTLIVEVNEASGQVAASSVQLSAGAQETGRASEQTVSIIQELTDGAEQQLDQLEASSDGIHRMSEHLTGIARNSGHVSEVAAHSAALADEGGRAITLSNEQMVIVDDKVAALSAIVHELNSLSHEIEGILDIITNIAGETNLLALNAAIEAARAGEHGRGFAVVAASVRKLSERSAESVGQITILVGQILRQMENATTTMEETSLEVARGTELVRSAGQAFGGIGQSAGQTMLAIEEVSESVGSLSQQAEKLAKAMESLVDIANTTVGGAQNMSAASEEQLAATEEVDASAAMLSSLAEKLQAQVERFKI